MRRLSILPIIVLAALSVAGCTAEEPVPPPARLSSPPTEITWDTARTAPVEDLVRLAFLPIGEDLVEVSRPGPPLPLNEGDIPPGRLHFATRAHHAGNYGLCQATVVVVPVNQTSEDEQSSIEAFPVYKVVGNTGRDAAPEWTDEYERRLERLCAKAGRVLDSDEPGHYTDGQFFFADVDEPWQLRYATHALQMAIAQARQRPNSVACVSYGEPVERECARPARYLSTFDMAMLTKVAMRPCVSRVGWQCVEAKFSSGWVVNLEAHVPDMHSETDVGALDKVTIRFEIILS